MPEILRLLHKFSRSEVEPGNWLASTNISWQMQKMAFPESISSKLCPVDLTKHANSNHVDHQPPTDIHCSGYKGSAELYFLERRSALSVHWRETQVVISSLDCHEYTEPQSS